MSYLLARFVLLALLADNSGAYPALASPSADDYGPAVNNLALRIVGKQTYSLNQPILVAAELENVGPTQISVLPVLGHMTFAIRDVHGDLVPTRDPVGCIFEGMNLPRTFNTVIQPGEARMDPGPRDLKCYAVTTGTYSVTASSPIFGSEAVAGHLPVVAKLTSNTIQVTIQ